jgi:hypothetical protein
MSCLGDQALTFSEKNEAFNYDEQCLCSDPRLHFYLSLYGCWQNVAATRTLFNGANQESEFCPQSPYAVQKGFHSGIFRSPQLLKSE